MRFGIAILGLNGAGKSTIAHALAKRLGYFEMDVEDYYFPEQRASRREALEGIYHFQEGLGDVLPFSNPRDKASVEAALFRDIRAHPRFILSGVTMNWREEILDAIGIAFLIEAPLEVRLVRVQGREALRFGNRVLPGGDMYEQQRAFAREIEKKEESVVEASAGRLRCPVIRLNGNDEPDRNLEQILSELSAE